MKKRVKKLINDGKYEEASAIADKCLGNFELDEAEEIYNAIYDKVTDEEGRDSSEAIYCLRHLADAAYHRGDYSLSLSMYNSALEWFDSNDNLNSSDALLTMHSIADIYEIHNRFDDEYEVCSKAFSISLENDYEDEKITCLLLKQLADCCVSLGKYDEGLSYYDHLLRIYQEDEAGYFEETALVFDGMGYAYKYKGMPLKSKQCFENGINLLNKYSQGDSVKLLMMLNDLCGLYDILSMLDEALELRKSIFERAKKLYGFDHPNVIVSKSNLAGAYSDIGDYNTAIRLYEECYRWSTENLDPGHREITRIKRCLSQDYIKTGCNEKALKLAEEVYSSYCDQMGQEHIDTIIALEEVGFCYIAMKNYRNAKEIFAESRKYFRNNYGENTDYYYSSENYLYACALLGEYSDILEETDKLLELNNSFPEPADTDNIINIKAIVCRGLKKFDEAEDYQKKHIDHNVIKYGEEHPDTLISKYELAYISFDKGDLKAAFEICSNTLEIQKVKSTNGSDVIKSEILLSRIYSSMGESEKAAGILEAIFDKTDICDHNAEYSDACFAMAENFRNMKQYEKAKEYAEKSLELRCKIYEDDYSDVKAARILCEELKNH